MELNSPLSPKRPRMDVTMTNNHNFEWRADLPELLTLQQTTNTPPSNNNLQKSVVLIYSAESGHVKDEQPQHTTFIIPPFSQASASHIDSTHTGLTTVSFITAERLLLNLQKDEQTSRSESDKCSSSLRNDAGGAFTDTHTLKDTCADMSSHPDCERLGKSLEDEPPGGNCLPAGDDKDWRQVQNNASQIQVFTLSSSDEEVRSEKDCTYEDVLHDTGVYNTGSQSDNQKKNGLDQISPSDYVDCKSFHSNPEEDPSGKLACGLNEVGKKSELQYCENENAAVCDREGLVNDGMSENSIPSVAECTEGSTVFHDVVLARNITAENVSASADDFCGAKEEHTTGKMIVTAGREAPDHTTETTVPAKISVEPTEGDNDPASFRVIDPAIRSETDREAEEKHCNSESSAAVERSPSVKVCEMETHEFSADDQDNQFNHQSTIEKCKEKEDLCLPDTEPHAHSTPINETHNMTGSESSNCWNASPSRSPHRPSNPHIENGRHESPTSEKHQLKEQNESDCVPVWFDHMKTQQLEYSHAASARMEKATDIKEREDFISFGEQIKPEEYQNLENTEGKCVQQNEKPKICERDNRFTLFEDFEDAKKEMEKVINCGQEIKINAIENSKTENLLQSEQRTDTTELTHIECISGLTGDNATKSGNTLSQDCRHNPSTAETLMAANKDDLSIFALAPASDAVVPCQHDSSHFQNANNNSTALNCNDRFSPVPSVFTFYDRMPRGFDTFKKIPLSPDDDEGDDDAGLGNSLLLTSLPRQLLKTSVQQPSLSVPGAESDKHEEIPGEEAGGKEEVAKFQHHIDNMALELLSSDCASNELPNFISEAEIIALRWPEQQPDCDSACEHIQPLSVSSSVSSEHDGPSDVNISSEFKMTKQFDMVLKELNLFFDISMNDFSSNSKESTPEQCSDAAGALESHVSTCKEHLRSPEMGRHRHSSDDADEDFGGDPVVSCASGGCEGEQEVPLGRHACQETPVKAAEKYREPRETEQRRKTWSPSFTCPLTLEQLSHRAPEQPRRLQPLRTCQRPIRVGLSKRARTKQLHRPAPYV
ncbi:uncharacterized protein LOC131443898 [Solea solea]|uniref:uncharacterized protein LOC131443898 n=1 Tax=Solea solea TaxID=90069 RepID=UPI00272BD1AB|nr:uncharacterized protein LOC131443898 [Solea solea]XP_058469947.1 uncharacterized protein LOC131443898 [Solea solea]